MEIVRVGSVFSAFIRPKDGANVGMLHTPKGIVLVDTASSPADIQALLASAHTSVTEVHQVINTHFHNDHTWGNQVFACPILAHRVCRERMEAALGGEWSPDALQLYLADLEKSDPKKATDFRPVLKSLQIKLPDEVFDDRFEGDLGGVNYEIIHTGGHTPDTSIVWLPQSRLLYASDLIFQGRYPFVFDSDVPAWIEALGRLLEFEAEVIIPGHGIPCRDADILVLRDYLQRSWDLVEDHFRLGHSTEETAADPAFPIFPGEKYERLHRANISYMYKSVENKSY